MVDEAHATSFQFCKDFFFFGDDDVSREESKDIVDGSCVFVLGILSLNGLDKCPSLVPPNNEPLLSASPA